jgi:hypothetical protein
MVHVDDFHNAKTEIAVEIIHMDGATEQTRRG